MVPCLVTVKVSGNFFSKVEPTTSADAFTKWYQWSNMVIRVDKCVTFGIKKFSSRSLQYEPKLFVNNKTVLTVTSGETLQYLGRYLNFEMDNKVHKEKLQFSLVDMLTNIDSFPILPKNILLLYQRYLLSKLSWYHTVANPSKTWISENLDSITIRFIRQWFDLLALP